MGLGDMISKLFKKENEKDIKADEIGHDGQDSVVDITNKAESSKTENIYKLQTLNVEEVNNHPNQSDDGTGEGRVHEETRPDVSEPSHLSAPPELSTDSTQTQRGEGPSDAEQVTGERVLEVLGEIYDPEIPIDIVNLGLIYGVSVEGGKVNVRMTLTSPGCPTAGQMVQEAQWLIEELPGVKEATIEVVWDPPWDPSKMSDEARRALGYM